MIPISQYKSVSDLETKLPDTRGGRIARSLCAVFPNRMAAKHLMLRAGFSYHAEPIHSFVQLCAAYYDINRFLKPLGWQVERTGGTPDAFYQLAACGGG